MLVIASEHDDYMLTLQYSEIKHLTGRLKNLVITNKGRTFKAYSGIPDYLIKNSLFMDVKVKRTTFVSSKTDFLNELGLYFDVNSGSVFEKSKIKALPSRKITAKNGFFVANHLPQIFYPFMGGYISALDGDYDVVSKIFKGSLTVRAYEDNPSES